MPLLKSKFLEKTGKEVRIGDRCEQIKPNVFEDCILQEGEEVIGFYINDLSKYSPKMINLLNIANTEFRSKNVPKSLLERSDVFQAVYRDGKTRREAKKTQTIQYSTIIGSIPPKPHMMRPYASRSSVHAVDSAQAFIKSMLMLAKESEGLLKKILPNQYETQKKELSSVDKKWKFAELFTSSISNFNISAPYHRDNGNVKNSVNVILTKRKNSIGGCLHVPDYDATFEQADNSMLVYPAWRNVHAVTPIAISHDNGYRNSFIFYALKAFQDTVEKEAA
jgi:hypothetical protein